MKIDKEQYMSLIWNGNVSKGLKIKKAKEKQLKEYIKSEVDNLIYKILDNNMYVFEYRDKMHKEILNELLEDIK